ncbi:MAG: hypothetical protein ACKVVP_12755 [Chloroflexota bacterium]
MPGPFDTTTKLLVQTYPDDWLSYLGLSSQVPAQVIDADLSTVAAEADKVLHIPEPIPYLVHLEFQASHDPKIGQRLARYNVLLNYRHNVPVLSVLVLLRPSADHPSTSGHWSVSTPSGGGRHDFRYAVRRIWTEPAQQLLRAPLGLLPFAPLADLGASTLSEVLREVDRRFHNELAPADARALEVVLFTLLGLRYPSDIVQQLFPGNRSMRESSTYQMILEEGREEGREVGRNEGRSEGRNEGLTLEARKLLILLASDKFGRPDPVTRSFLDGLSDITELERLTRRVLVAQSWADLISPV